MKTIIILVGIIFTVLLTTSCTNKPEDQILGKWRDQDNMVWEFAKDGKLSLTRSGYGSKDASWALSKDGDITITIDQDIKTLTPKFSDNGALEFFLDGNSVALFSRLDNAEESSSSMGIIGKFGGKNCIYDVLDFRSGGKVYIKVFGNEIPGTYAVDGEKLSVLANGAGAVFTKNGDVLDGGITGKCSRL